MGNKYTEAQSKASKKYIRENTDQIMIRVPKGEKQKIVDHAKKHGYESTNAFVIESIYDKMNEQS